MGRSESERIMRVLVCGSRSFDDAELIRQVLNGVFWGTYDPRCVIHGGAQGADTLAGEWAQGFGIGSKTQVYPADWERHGRAAVPIRNRQMLAQANPDLVVAFIDKPLEQSKGTADMVRIARAAGVKTVIVEVAS